MPTTSTVQWPDDLPSWVMWDGFQAGGPEGTATFQVDDGPQKRRPRVSKIARHHTYAVLLTLVQWDRLERFYETDTARGSLTFAKRSPITDQMVDWQFRARPTAEGHSARILRATIQVASVP